jgi:hypothetical protein
MTARRLVWVLGGLMALLVIASLPLASLANTLENGGAADDAKLALLLLPFAVVGGIVAARQPRNPIGWIMLALALLMELSTDAGMYAVWAFRLGHPGAPFARLSVALTETWIALLVLLPLPIALFPDGRLHSRFWRVTAWAYAVVTGLLLAGTAIGVAPAFTDRIVRIDSGGELTSLANHRPLSFIPLPPIYAAILVAWAIGKVFEYRRATGERRQQLKWLLAGGTVSIVALLLTLSLHGSIFFAGIVALPISIGIGILKYRLYEIDRLVSRTISYAVVTGLLVAMFIGLVALTTDVLPFSSPVGVAASTLAAAALFNPLRLRVQRLVDRRFNRARYDGEAAVQAFARQMRDSVDVETVRAGLVDAIGRAVEPASISVWVRSTT